MNFQYPINVAFPSRFAIHDSAAVKEKNAKPAKIMGGTKNVGDHGKAIPGMGKHGR